MQDKTPVAACQDYDVSPSDFIEILLWISSTSEIIWFGGLSR